MTKEQFATVTSVVIDNLEGGYYHPDMMKDGRLRYNSQLAKSGETMLGLDRVNGAQLSRYPGWQSFWSILDREGARRKWKWNYKGGAMYEPLKRAAIQIMYDWYNYLAGKYLTEKSRRAIDQDPRLILHFSYASWNGEGFFKRFARAFNEDTAANKPMETLAANALRQRTHNATSLIRQSGAKIARLFQELKNGPQLTGIKDLGKSGAGAVIVALLVFSLFIYKF